MPQRLTMKHKRAGRRSDDGFHRGGQWRRGQHPRASFGRSDLPQGRVTASRDPADQLILHPTQGGCSRVTELYSAVMADHPRYAIYHAPAAGSDLDRFGAQLLGYDAYTGEEMLFPNDIIRMAPHWLDLTKDPRKYVFHATLKAPMSLAPGRTEPELLAACESFAGKPRPIPVLTPVVGSLSGFIAVVPAAPSP